MIGTVDEATKAVKGEFSHLGSGCFRAAYINDDKTVVYKIAHGDATADYINEYEYGNSYVLNLMEDLPEYVRVPEVSLYQVEGRSVVASPYIPGTPFDYGAFPHSKDLWAWFAKAGVRDMGGCNIRMLDGIAHLVDLGYDW